MDELQRQFIADAGEIIERLCRDLEELRAVRSQGRRRRELAARIFRHVHTLKGSAVSLELQYVGQIAHEFEAVLDGLRLGRGEITDEVLDAFEDAADAIARALKGAADRKRQAPETAVVERLAALAAKSKQQGSIADSLRSALPAEIARALSEYDLQHAREAIREGAKLFIVSAGFTIDTFDRSFREVSKLLGQSGEIIATVPGGPSTANDINFRLVYAAEIVSNDVIKSASKLGRIEVSELSVGSSAASARAAEETGPAPPLWHGALRTPSVQVDLKQIADLISETSDLFRETSNALGSLGEPANKQYVDTTTAYLRRRFSILEDRLIRLRLVPCADLLAGAAVRAGRIAARQLGKEVEFEIEGGDVGIDKSLADTIVEPLLHLVRNAIGHGIESPRERAAAGKSTTGKVRLRAFSEGTRIYVTVADDGRGIDLARIATAACQQGIVTNRSDLTSDQCLRLIFRPGFSTSTEVSEMSGRGIGLEVVDRAMEQAGGEVRVAIEPGRGTTFVMILPAALALLQCVIVRSGDQFYGIGSAGVAGMRSLSAAESNQTESANTIRWKQETLPVLSLRSLLAQPAEKGPEQGASMIVWQRANNRGAPGDGRDRFAVIVDLIAGQHETLVRSLGPHASRWPGIAGAAELADGQIALVLDVQRLIEG